MPGYAPEKVTKPEIRSTKFETISNDQNPKQCVVLNI